MVTKRVTRKAGYAGSNMATRHRKRTNRARLILPAITVAVLGYFGFHALNGQHGIRSHLRMQGEIVKLERRLARLEFNRSVLQARVDLLKEGNIEEDMLDERARYSLDLVRPDEVVIMGKWR